MASLDERGFVADGEVVWSWHPDAGVKFRGSFPRGDGGKRARSPAIECTHLLLRRPAKTDSLLGLALEGAMREEIGLGRFGDRRLEKGGCRCMRRLYEGPVRVFDALLETERGKFSSRAFCATRG